MRGLSAPLPQGAGRNREEISDDNTGFPSTMVTRFNQGEAQNAGQSNIGISGAGINAWAILPCGGTTPWARWVASQLLGPFLAAHIQQPAVQFQWQQGRFIVECVASWPVNPAVGVTSGVCWMNTNHTVLLTGSVDGVGIVNNGGQLQFVSKGAGGTETVNLSAFAGPMNGYNKLALIFVQPTKARPARIIAKVNDVSACVREYSAGHKLPVPLGRGWWTQMIHASNPDFFWTTQLHIGYGRDYDEL